MTEAFGSHPSCLNLLQGDLLSTLPAASIENESIDAVLLDIWAPLALPSLKILKPKLRRGAVLFVDNSVVGEERYRDLFGELRREGSGFLGVNLPFQGGLEMCIYVGV